MTEPSADAWIAAWEAEAAEDGLERGSEYWEAGWAWIAAQRERRVRPAIPTPTPAMEPLDERH